MGYQIRDEYPTASQAQKPQAFPCEGEESPQIPKHRPIGRFCGVSAGFPFPVGVAGVWYFFRSGSGAGASRVDGMLGNPSFSL